MIDAIAISTLAASIVSKCYRLASEVTNLSGLLIGLQGVADQHESYLESLNLYKILLECSADLKAVDSQLEGLVPGAGQTKTRRIVKRLRWPLQRGDTLLMLEHIERQKGSLSFVLESLTTRIVSDQQKEAQDLSRAFQALDARIASKEELAVEQSVLDWVCD
ncbi:hypothetical protein GJ744_005396 [Endocarpon pusillum]|uniref:Fungal N-terminal domain-containing protein n=1 Tax=Endocarpon pusillum TaxID=364733 RepID=A0A8H7DYS1_9EURO|nr:hypothetical protein GJ744_005396 [Endocarpon pusillum]